MHALTRTLTDHGPAFVFAFVLLKQLGLPLPGAALMLVAGAVARNEGAPPATLIGLAVLASVLGHAAWFQAGRMTGGRVLRLVCRISLEPDQCVRRGMNMLTDRGRRAIVLSYFIPGVDLVVQPLAAISGMRWPLFLVLNITGASLWACTYVGVGYALGPQLEAALDTAERLRAPVGRVLLLSFVAYLAWKWLQRRRALRALHHVRIEPQELRRRIDAGEAPFVVDLRHSLERAASPATIPGAVAIAEEELEDHLDDIPRDREVVTLCNCPGEVTAARVAYRLRRQGVVLVRPLAGGLDAWRALGYPMTEGAPAERAG